MILCGAVLILFAFTGFQIYQSATSINFISADEIYYSYYMNYLAGPVSTEKLEWLQKEGEKFTVLSKANQAYSSGKINEQEYQNIVSSNYNLQREYSVYQQVVNKLYYIKDHPGAYFVYDSGYPILFDYTDQQDSRDVLISGLILTMSCCGFFSIEYATDMQRVVRSTPNGRRKLFQKKFSICSILAITVSLLVLFPRLWQVGTGYGFSAVTAPLYSLTEYSTASVSIPIFMLLFVSLLARIIAGWVTAVVILLLSQRLKNMLSAALVGGLIFCMPPLLDLYGLTVARWFSLYPLFHFGAMMQESGNAIAAWLFLVIWLFIGCEILYCTYSNWCD